ncbi:MAG: TonB-dependent receptor, partial [Gammaproteobacteria bacterium]|nr:TonB-dependent receptor [Gammaproteobacteria bacterium]
KFGLRWQPTRDLGLRGDYSTGFRAPNLGELYGLTQFGATLVDPCGPTGTIVVTPGSTSPLAQACRAQGVPNNFQQANTQITTFTGGNAHLRPEKSKSFTVGFVYNASWAENLPGTDRLTLESTYYHHKVTGAIEAADIQSLLNACLAAGGTNPTLCSGFTRGAGGNLNPPDNFLENLGEITTDGEDIKLNWGSSPLPFGNLSLSVMLTRVNGYKAVDSLGNVSQRAAGIEVNNSAIPRYRMNAQIGYGIADLQVTWTVRYLSAVTEYCSDATFVGVPGCATTTDMHTLNAVAYNDISAAYYDAFRLQGLMIQAGVNNLFGVNPPVCYSCTLNGYDAGTYDLPGAFWN